MGLCWFSEGLVRFAFFYYLLFFYTDRQFISAIVGLFRDDFMFGMAEKHDI
jgi:hypothetical protein